MFPHPVLLACDGVGQGDAPPHRPVARPSDVHPSPDTHVTGSRVATTPTLEVVPLGGLGEFGMNMMAFSCAGTTIVVDAGVMFPEPELPGVELIIPDLSYLQQLETGIAALVLTHGHEDHIGAVPYVLPLMQGPICGTPLTLALLEPKLQEHRLSPEHGLQTVRPGERIQIGAFDIEFLRVTHSMPDCVALAIHTPLGTLIHTGDFKLDQTPLDGEHADLQRLAELGRDGVLALFGDSTNIDRRGFSGSEMDVVEAFEEIFASTTGKIVVATFASAIHRMQVLVDLAVRFDRRVAFVGRSIAQNSVIAQRLGHLRIPAGVEIRDHEVMGRPGREVLCITTGSQGEPLAALSRIAINDHRHIRLAPSDTVVFSARAIPGNEKSIGRVMNHIARRGADIVHEGTKRVHVSGHGSEEEIKLMLSLVRPCHFVPIHGEYRQLARHAQVAERLTGGRASVLLSENGDILRFDVDGGQVVGKAPSGRVLIDGTRTGEIVDEVLRDRRHLAGDGLVVPVVAINTQGEIIDGAADIITRGFVVDQRTDGLLAEALATLAEIINAAGLEERTDYGLIKERILVELQRFFRKRSGRRPLVLPVIMEI